MSTRLSLLPLAGALALTLLSGCANCRDGDIGNRHQLAEGGGVGNIVTATVENAVWWPWKAVTTPVVGTVQGARGWYAVTGEPISATLTLPLGAAIGLAHGTVNAIGQEPFFVERDDNLVEVLANPFITDQEVWKYTTPPRGRPDYINQAGIYQRHQYGGAGVRQDTLPGRAVR